MRSFYISLVVGAVLPASVSAWDAPSYSGFSRIWQETFSGSGGSLPSSSTWNIITNLHVNNEVQTYTASSSNLQLSGGSTLQIVPQKDGNGAWTSSRIESTYTFTPVAGGRTMAEADIRFGDNPISNKQGLWPAFWMLGDSIRSGTSWPACGEVDALETVNGDLTGYGTAHCGYTPGGPCNEPTGLSSSVAFADQSWHTWRVEWDRTSNYWATETITWYLDGQAYSSINGAQVNNEDDWSSICHEPLFFILNMAVGGTWPGPPNDETEAGWGSMMEVAYVAVYTT